MTLSSEYSRWKQVNLNGEFLTILLTDFFRWFNFFKKDIVQYQSLKSILSWSLILSPEQSWADDLRIILNNSFSPFIANPSVSCADSIFCNSPVCPLLCHCLKSGSYFPFPGFLQWPNNWFPYCQSWLPSSLIPPCCQRSHLLEKLISSCLHILHWLLTKIQVS